jgi:glycosyltransferase involved in cell wall biosynthesis
MKKFWPLFLAAVSCYGVECNYAPKVTGEVEEKPIVVIIPSYNNEEFYAKNLDSIFMQKYSNYRVIYANDASTDKTGELVLKYSRQLEHPEQFTMVNNKVNIGPIGNIYHMIHSCKDDEIIVTVDGDDWLLNDRVLERINQAYADDRVWMTYGSDTNSYIPNGHSKPMRLSILKDGTHRKCRWSWSHIRTCYAGLFKTIPEGRWLRDGKFFDTAGDVAFILYLIDLSGEHTFYIPEKLYYYNMDNPLNEYKGQLPKQRSNRKYIWSQPPLEKLMIKKDFIKELKD